MNVLTSWDYVVFVLILFMSASIGIYYRFTGGRQKTVEEYMLANQSMTPTPVAFSLMASFMSAVTLLGVSSENYMYGTQFMVINVSYVLGTPIVAYVYLPVFYRLKSLSAYEYLEHRFGVATRLAASAAFSMQMILYMGIVLYAPALALSAVTGLNKVFAILSIGFVCTFYSSIGGMKAVLITDVFQSLLMFAAVYCVIIGGIIDMDGIGNIFRIANEGNRIQFFDFSLDPTIRHTVWSQIIGGMFVFLSLYAVNQAQVQRLLTVRDLKNAQRSLWISLPILMFLSFSTAFAGLTIYAKYSTCDPILCGRITQPDQLLPLFVVESLEGVPGLTGLFVAGLLSGSLSTVSSAINSLAAVTWEDYVMPVLKWKGKNPPPIVVTLTNKMLALTYGIICIGMAFLAEMFTGVLQASLTIFGVVGGPLLGLFTLGMIFPFTSEKAVIPAFLFALACGMWIGFGGPKPPLGRLVGGSACNVTSYLGQCKLTPISSTPVDEYLYPYRISYMWYTLLGFSLTIVVGTILSLWFPQMKTVDPSLLSPALRKILNVTSIRRKNLGGSGKIKRSTRSNTNSAASSDPVIVEQEIRVCATDDPGEKYKDSTIVECRL